MGRNCSAKNCQKNDARNVNTSFFKFPDDVTLCAKWIEFCASPQLTAAFQASGPYGIRGRKICSDHFTRDSFRAPLNTHQGLKYGAVPRLNTNAEEYLDVEYLEDSESTDVTKEVDTPMITSKRKKVEKRYYVQGRHDLFEVLILEDPQKIDNES
uniref:THAP domain-containing protein 1 n=1 Tax=Culex pipiens TaxID=7175 RepID=A0A8D8ALH1_CULPI